MKLLDNKPHLRHDNRTVRSIGAMSQHQYLVADALDIQARFMASIDNARRDNMLIA
ncbi:MAG: hypothetical protein LBD23_07880 [Oscillospiraceae bacterium]|jgi:hypothetical protein|nr:hypothetical protein [Oscillospiraceae bacterium]